MARWAGETSWRKHHRGSSGAEQRTMHEKAKVVVWKVSAAVLCTECGHVQAVFYEWHRRMTREASMSTHTVCRQCVPGVHKDLMRYYKSMRDWIRRDLDRNDEPTIVGRTFSEAEIEARLMEVVRSMGNIWHVQDAQERD